MVADLVNKLIEDNTLVIPQPEFRLRDDLGLDHLSLTALALLIEAETGVVIGSSDIESWRTVGDVLRCVEKKAKAC